jgi:hypothetical protein
MLGCEEDVGYKVPQPMGQMSAKVVPFLLVYCRHDLDNFLVDE